MNISMTKITLNLSETTDILRYGEQNKSQVSPNNVKLQYKFLLHHIGLSCRRSGFQKKLFYPFIKNENIYFPLTQKPQDTDRESSPPFEMRDLKLMEENGFLVHG